MKNAMAKIPTCECSSRIMDRNAGFVFVLSPSSNGKEIEEFTRGLVFVSLAAKKKTFAKFVH